jgi:hypothetical protein
MRFKLLYLSSTEWGNLGRRKVRLAYELSRQKDVAAVLFVDPPVSTSILDLARGRFAPSHLPPRRRAHAEALLGRPRRVEPRLWVQRGSIKTLPLTRVARLRESALLGRLNQRLHLAGLERACRKVPGEALVLWLNHPLQAFALDAFPERLLCCFDWTDDWSEFARLPVADRAELERMTERILRRADVVFAVSQVLYERARALNPHAHLAPNATDFELLSREPAANGVGLADLPRPRLGYVGQIADSIDLELVRAVAEARPGWSFVFIGPIWESRAAEVAALERLANVRFVGAQPHGSLPDLLAAVDVCVLPHLRNELTRSMDPTKLYDYLASGKPIASTRVAGTERFAASLHLGDGADGFVRAVEKALQEDGRGAAERRRHAAENDWPRRASEMWAAVRRSA